MFALVIAASMLRGAGSEALTWDHVHLAFQDPHAATEWYIKYLGATARPDGMDGVLVTVGSWKLDNNKMHRIYDSRFRHWTREFSPA